MQNTNKIRISKFIASSGTYSRREAEKLITNGDVTVNNNKITHPLFFITDKDQICIKGKLLSKQTEIKLFLYNKPRNVITSHKDPEKRRTVFENVPKNLGRLISIGRLDYNTEGLLLLTNNGFLKRYMELPANKIERSYRVKIKGEVKNLKIREIKRGIYINKIQYAPIKIKIINQTKNTAWLELKLIEGKNREIRKIIEYFGMKVIRLVRISYGQFHIHNLKKNEIIEVNKNKYKNILNIIKKDKPC